jgi:NCS1 family nucleobase:cation symporter-1
MGNIAFWSTLSLNMPDFTRFGRSQREQAIGQAVGLPVTMTLFPLVGVLTTSATFLVYGETIWDPVALTAKMDNPIMLVVMLLALALATLTTNVAANVVSPSYDFSNAWPKRISFRTGGIITGIIGVLIMPWNLLADSQSYIFTWLGTYGGATGPIAGVLIADYWWVRRRQLKLADLYRSTGKYRYASGWNWIAVVSLLVGVVMAVGGAYSAGGAPFPENGIIPFLKSFYDFSWLTGLVVAFVLYGVLTMVIGNREATTEA